MLIEQRMYYSLINFLLPLFIKSRAIPIDPRSIIELNPVKPIMYVLPYNSKIDLLTLRMLCLKYGLPDPLISLKIKDIVFNRYIFAYDKKKLSKYIDLFRYCIKLNYLNPTLDVQLVPVLVMFGRYPKKRNQFNLILSHLNFRKIFSVIWLGCDSFVQFSRPLFMRHIIIKYENDNFIVQKLIRFVRIHFFRQQLIATGPKLIKKHDLFVKLLTSKIIRKAIEDEMRNKKCSVRKIQQNTIKLMKEISANFSYEAIRLSDRVLSWIYNRIYQGLCVSKAERVRQLAEIGHEIIYLPCHRSHMDYLLLSYVLYYHGLVPPHIAAGINLNFWPVGPILRRLGAFFIRRSFKGNRLYSTIFREYLSELFNHGYSVEYFIEGGRSRTGFLIEPKTGTLTMTIQAMLRGIKRPISLIPVYIGYEHSIEVSTYIKELHGESKKKEGFWQTLSALRKLKNLGQGYINFGNPISLTPWLSKRVPHWRNSINSIEIQRPDWLVSVVNEIASTIMIRINNSAATNAINLCSSILLVAYQNSLTQNQLLIQLSCYLDLLRNVPYAPDVTIPNLTPKELLEYALTMNAVKTNIVDNIIFLSPDQKKTMTYYRNNIQHLLILPSLIANIIINHTSINYEVMMQYIVMFYPLLKAELFMRFNEQQLPIMINNIIEELARQHLINLNENELSSSDMRFHELQLLAALINETLQRYAITFLLLNIKSQLNQTSLKQESQKLAKRISIICDINSPEFFDKKIFANILDILRKESYIDSYGKPINKKIIKMCNILNKLINKKILNTIINCINDIKI